MKKTKISEPDLDNFLKQTLKDDLPPEAEARMNRSFFSLKRVINRPEGVAEPDARNRRGERRSPERWLWVRGTFGKEILAFSSAVMLALGGVMHLGGYQSALAHSISRLKVVVAVSERVYRATSMDCTVLQPGAGGENSYYRVRWRAAGATRVDSAATGGAGQTWWISDGTVSMADAAGGPVRSAAIATLPPDPALQPALEFLTPTILAQRMEERYGLKQAGPWVGAGPGEFLLVGQEDQNVVEIAVDERTYLPTTLKKYLPHSSRPGGERSCLMEVRITWNQPIPRELLVPGLPAGKRPVNH